MLRRLVNRFIRSSFFVCLCESLPLPLKIRVLKSLLNSDRSRILILHGRLRQEFLSYRPYESRLDLSKPTILGYMPAESGGWILEFLFNDISSFANRSNFLLIKNPIDLCLQFSSSSQPVVFCLHPSFAKQIINLGISPDNIISYYTHSRLGMDISSLGRLRALLPMNSTEASLLALSNIDPAIIRVFPAGYDPALFCMRDAEAGDLNNRSIDVLFVCRYWDPSYKHVSIRKAYQAIRFLGKALAIKGYKVAVLGSDWEHCGDDHFLEVVQIINTPHKEYPSIYRNSKLLITRSRQEGGPVSWLEGMACGCLTLSTCSGFPTELRSGQLGSFLMPLRASEQEWVAEIARILDLPWSAHPIDMLDRESFLAPATFRALTSVLEDIACYHDLKNPSLIWPSSS